VRILARQKRIRELSGFARAENPLTGSEIRVDLGYPAEMISGFFFPAGLPEEDGQVQMGLEGIRFELQGFKELRFRLGVSTHESIGDSQDRMGFGKTRLEGGGLPAVRGGLFKKG
jgi:hypothetical protein